MDESKLDQLLDRMGAMERFITENYGKDKQQPAPGNVAFVPSPVSSMPEKMNGMYDANSYKEFMGNAPVSGPWEAMGAIHKLVEAIKDKVGKPGKRFDVSVTDDQGNQVMQALNVDAFSVMVHVLGDRNGVLSAGDGSDDGLGEIAARMDDVKKFIAKRVLGDNE